MSAVPFVKLVLPAAAVALMVVSACSEDSGSSTPSPTGTGGTAGGHGGQGGQGGQGGVECASGVYCGPAMQCCAIGEECVNEMQCLPVCETVRCGENLVDCCEASQICLDGVVCAADCLPQEALCGAALDTCCPSGDVCVYDGCVTPGIECDDNFDCLDEAYYCELTLGRCLPLPSGELCQGQPLFHDIEPALEWSWTGVEYNGVMYRNIIAAPAVGDVNGDGTPDIVVVVYAGTSTTNTLVVVLSGAGNGAGGGEVLFTIPSAADPSAPRPFWLGAVALANFDADVGLEIVYATQSNTVRIADNTGVGHLGQRAVPAGMDFIGGPSVADLNHDGVPDVILKCHALDGTNIEDPSLDLVNRDCAQSGSQGAAGRSSTVADLNLDGVPEVLTASRAYSANAITGGDLLWSNSQISGHIAVADILPDIPGPEVVNIYAGFSLINGLTGAVLVGTGGSLIDYAIPIPGGGRGGAPTVADFDGDGLPEVSSAGLSHYVVYDPDCWDPPLRAGGQCASGRTDFKLWETPTQDASSHRTGSSVFDFQGDGAAEVLYNDECFFHIYDGTTGAELVSPVLPSSSQTASEYPLVADVDGDGNAEIVVISSDAQAYNRDDCDTAWKNAGVDINLLCVLGSCHDGGPCVGGSCDHLDGYHGDTYWDAFQCDGNDRCQQARGIGGVRVYGDLHDRWVKTRPVWNQFHYHVTNFEYQAGWWNVPPHEEPNWTSFNNYRQNVQGGVAFPVPDLTVELTATPVCPTEVKLSAKIMNLGSAGAAAGVAVHFYRIDSGASNPPELLGTMSTSTIILPGGWERLALSYAPLPLGIDLQFAASVDPMAALEECDAENNDAVSNVVRCEPVPR